MENTTDTENDLEDELDNEVIFATDELGIPILEDVVIPGIDIDPATLKFQRASIGRRGQDGQPHALSIADTRIIVTQLEPILSRLLDQAIKEKLGIAIENLHQEITDEIKDKLIIELNKIVRSRFP